MNDRRLEILLVDQARQLTEQIESAIRALGNRITTIDSSDNLLKVVEEQSPDLILFDMVTPDDQTLEQIKIINRHKPTPVVVFAENGERKIIEKVVKAGVSAYVVDGLSPHRIGPIIDIAVTRFRERVALESELEKTRATLEERKIIDRAKGMLMQHKGCTEEEAYRSLRKTAMSKNQRMVDVAQNLITSLEMLV